MPALRLQARRGAVRHKWARRAYGGWGIAPAPMKMIEPHGAFEISWEEPPVIGYKWKMTVTSDDPRLFALVQRSVVTLIAPTRERALSDAREFVEFICGVDLAAPRRARRS